MLLQTKSMNIYMNKTEFNLFSNLCNNVSLKPCDSNNLHIKPNIIL